MKTILILLSTFFLSVSFLNAQDEVKIKVSDSYFLEKKKKKITVNNHLHFARVVDGKVVEVFYYGIKEQVYHLLYAKAGDDQFTQILFKNDLLLHLVMKDCKRIKRSYKKLSRKNRFDYFKNDKTYYGFYTNYKNATLRHLIFFRDTDEYRKKFQLPSQTTLEEIKSLFYKILKDNGIQAWTSN